jgi:UrcA family protein
VKPHYAITPINGFVERNTHSRSNPMHPKNFPPIAAALAVAACFGGAQAQTVRPMAYESEPVHQVVRFGDLDLATGAGAQRLAFRIRVAAQSVCGGDNTNIRFSTGFEDCVRTSIAQAAAGLHNSMVTSALGLSPNGPELARR